MSLLLDALKKAAKDKEARSATATAARADTQTGSAIDNELPELSLEDASAEALESEQDDAEAETETETELSVDKPRRQSEKPSTTANTVSDEALQVLIYKTNHAYQRKRWMVWGSAAAISIAVLAISGIYFINQIQHETSTLERGHRINMQTVQAEPVKTAAPESAAQQSTASTEVKSAAPRQVVSEKPKHATTQAATQNATRTASLAAAKTTPVRYTSTDNNISIVRGEKADPVSTLLNRAWQAYNSADYPQANNLYAQVLEREKNNRDALMGLGAIALKSNDSNSALQYYNKLLQLDPRDPVANAAISSLRNGPNANTLNQGKLEYLLRLNPEAAPLHYALGNKYAAQDKWPEAQAAYFSAFEHDGANADYAYNLAVSLERIGKPEEATRYYKYALALMPNSNISFSADVVTNRLRQLQP